MVSIKLLEDIPEDTGSDYMVKISTRFIRGTLEPNIEDNINLVKEPLVKVPLVKVPLVKEPKVLQPGTLACLVKDVLKGENTIISYVRDICDEKYDTLDKMNSSKCLCSIL